MPSWDVAHALVNKKKLCGCAEGERRPDQNLSYVHYVRQAPSQHHNTSASKILDRKMSAITTAKTHGLRGGRTPAAAPTAWMGSSNMSYAFGARKSCNEGPRTENDTGKSSAASEMTPTLASAEAEAVITREDSTSSLDHHVAGEHGNEEAIDPNQTMIGEKDTPNISAGTHGSATNDKEPAAERVGTKGIILGKWRFKSKQSLHKISSDEAERLEKDLRVEDISKSLKDVLLEEDDLGI